MNDTMHETKSINDRSQFQKPPSLYKYVTLERALQIVRDGEIRLTQPSLLNDPHEMCVEINPISLVRDFYEFALFKGMTAESASEMVSRNIIDQTINQVNEIVAARDTIGVLSLSDCPKNMLLWAHYGHEHRGAVLELDISALQSQKRDPASVQVLTDVIYQDKRVDFIAEKLPPWSTLRFKSRVWAYEREWRFLKSLSELRHKVGDVYVADLPFRAIKRVIFGARAMGSQEEEVLDLIRKSETHRHINVQKAVFTNDIVGLEFKSPEEFAIMLMHGNHHFDDHWRELRQWVDLTKLKRAELGEGLPSKE